MNLLEILSTSPHYFCRKWIGATTENFQILILGFKGLIALTYIAGPLSSTFDFRHHKLGHHKCHFHNKSMLFQTHENREHLAMMERILGPLPSHMIKKSRSVLNNSITNYATCGLYLLLFLSFAARGFSPGTLKITLLRLCWRKSKWLGGCCSFHAPCYGPDDLILW